VCGVLDGFDVLDAFDVCDVLDGFDVLDVFDVFHVFEGATDEGVKSDELISMSSEVAGA
jgi:hypothetical protein